MQQRFKRSSQVVRRRVGGETLLVPIRTAAADGGGEGETLFIVLNETAEVLWEQLAAPRSAGDLAQHLITHYEVATSQAQADVQAFLEDLRAARMLEVEEG